MPSGLHMWSSTAATNATADSTVNWAEGQAPSTINDSARAMMAVVAKYRDDIHGALVTTGSGAAYALTTNTVFTTLALMANQCVAFTPHATNTGTATLNVDGLGAKPLRSAPGVEIVAGTLIQGTPYLALYNNSDAVWYLHGVYGNAYAVPIGSALPFFGTTAPNSAFVLPYGQAISRTTYSVLFGLFGTTFGSGDGSTTFNVPDLRGRVIAGLDNMGGSAASRLTTIGSGTTLGAAGGEQTHTLTTAEIPSHTHVNTLTDPGHTHGPLGGGQFIRDGGTAAFGSGPGSGQAAATTSSNTTGISITNAAAGGGGAHNVLQPTMLGNFILRII